MRRSLIRPLADCQKEKKRRKRNVKKNAKKRTKGYFPRTLYEGVRKWEHKILESFKENKNSVDKRRESK